MISKCGKCQGRLKRIDTEPGKRRSTVLAKWRCEGCGHVYSQRLRQAKGPIEGTTLAAKGNLGVSATRFGPLYVDTEPGSGKFFISIDLGVLGGLRLRLTPEGWKADYPTGSQKGTWE